MIHSAAELQVGQPMTLESHPEVVFSALAQQRLPAEGKKTLFLGLLARASLLQQQGLALNLGVLTIPRIPSDNFLDAIAMALVARAWNQCGPNLDVIRCADGTPEHLGDQRTHLIALPTPNAGRPEASMTADELMHLAANFQLEA
jgi:hypothetical protein